MVCRWWAGVLWSRSSLQGPLAWSRLLGTVCLNRSRLLGILGLDRSRLLGTLGLDRSRLLGIELVGMRCISSLRRPRRRLKEFFIRDLRPGHDR